MMIHANRNISEHNGQERGLETTGEEREINRELLLKRNKYQNHVDSSCVFDQFWVDTHLWKLFVWHINFFNFANT